MDRGWMPGSRLLHALAAALLLAGCLGGGHRAVSTDAGPRDSGALADAGHLCATGALTCGTNASCVPTSANAAQPRPLIARPARVGPE